MGMALHDGKYKKPRKPDGRTFNGRVTIDKLEYWVNFKDFSLYPKEARKLADWLLRAAEYLESKEE